MRIRTGLSGSGIRGYMMRSNEHMAEEFRPVGDILALVGDKWAAVLLGRLRNGTKRFNELKRDIDGISAKTLSVKLRNLERDGLVLRTLYPTIPPRVDYELTRLGQQLLHSLDDLAEFAIMHQFQVERSRRAFDEGLEIDPAAVEAASRQPGPRR
jgi:DNA-binding HxlR family transcriptional regulator